MIILLTGAAGMVGRNVLEHPAAASHEWLRPTSSELDLCDWQATLRFVLDHRPDLIIHAAARVGGIQANMREPVSFFVRNMDMGRNVVLAAREAGVRRLINLGSSCMYPRDRDTPLAEDDVLHGALEPTNEGYAIAKIATARLCQYVRQEDARFEYKTLIPCNLYGRWDTFHPARSHMIPAAIRKVHAAKAAGRGSVEIWGDGCARREFMFAADLAGCVARCLEDENFSSLPDLMNVGLGHDYTINEYYTEIAAVVGYDGDFEHDLDKPTGMKRKVVSTERLRDWGWVAPTSLRDGLAETYRFFLEQEAG